MQEYYTIIVVMMVLAIIVTIILSLVNTVKNFSIRKEEYKKYINQSKLLPKSNLNYYSLYKGILEEFEVYKILHKKLIGEYKFFNSVYLTKCNQDTTEIDFVVIHEKGIFVLEVKNLYGYIYGEIDSKEWVQRIEESRRNKLFYNPIMQNENHIKYLKEKVDIREYNLHDENIYSIIVFGENSNIETIKVNEDTLKIIKSSELEQTLNSIIEEKRSVLDESQIIDLSLALEEYTDVDELVKVKHIDSINQYS